MTNPTEPKPTSPAMTEGTMTVEQALQMAANKFRDYQTQHLEKGTVEGVNKAKTNELMALICERALASGRALQACASLMKSELGSSAINESVSV